MARVEKLFKVQQMFLSQVPSMFSPWQDDHSWTWSGVLWYNRQCKGEDPRQRRVGFTASSLIVWSDVEQDPASPTTPHLCRQTTRRWPNSLWLLHSKRVNPPSRSPPPWRHANLCKDIDRQDHHSGSRLSVMRPFVKLLTILLPAPPPCLRLLIIMLKYVLTF